MPPFRPATHLRPVYQHQFGFCVMQALFQFFDFAFAEQHTGVDFGQAHDFGPHHFQVWQGRSQRYAFRQSGFGETTIWVGFHIRVQHPSPCDGLVVFKQSYSSPS